MAEIRTVWDGLGGSGGPHANYLSHVASDGRVGVILLLMETVRDPALFAGGAHSACPQQTDHRAEAGAQRDRACAGVGALWQPGGRRPAVRCAFRAPGIVAAHDLNEK